MDEVSFPLRVSDNGGYLIDANDELFFYPADTAWMLLLNRTVSEADEYFAIKEAQGARLIRR